MYEEVGTVWWWWWWVTNGTAEVAVDVIAGGCGWSPNVPGMCLRRINTWCGWWCGWWGWGWEEGRGMITEEESFRFSEMCHSRILMIASWCNVSFETHPRIFSFQLLYLAVHSSSTSLRLSSTLLLALEVLKYKVDFVFSFSDSVPYFVIQKIPRSKLPEAFRSCSSASKFPSNSR